MCSKWCWKDSHACPREAAFIWCSPDHYIRWSLNAWVVDLVGVKQQKIHVI